MTHDGADVSDVLLPGGRFMKIVLKFSHLGGVISSSDDDAADVGSRRIASAGRAFGVPSARCEAASFLVDLD